MKYFDLLEIPCSFHPDPDSLKKNYYRLSRSLHPDFHTQKDEATKNELLIKSGELNTAYTTLMDKNRRIKYILEEYGLIKEGENNAIPQDFLLEIMDINEEVMDLSVEFDSLKYDQTLEKIEGIQASLDDEFDRNVLEFDTYGYNLEILKKIRDYYYKSRYLLRIRENIFTFASPFNNKS